MDKSTPCPRPLQQRDAAAMIGLLAIMEGEVWGHALDEHLLDHLRRRLAEDGLLGENASSYDLRQALNDLNHRVRYALGEYDEPPTSIPLPP